MKKIIALVICITLSNCEIKPREASATDWYKTDHLNYTTKDFEGMTYLIISPGKYGANPYSGPFVINLTKDKLEVELLSYYII